MSELFFILKSILLTLVVVVLMRIKIGPLTLEERTTSWVQSAAITLPIQEVANGGVKLIREGWKRVFGNLNSKFFNSVDSSQAPGKRHLGINMKRSEEYLRNQATRLKKEGQEYWTSTREKVSNQIKDSEHLNEIKGADHLNEEL